MYGKLSTRRIEIYCVYFCVIHFWPLIFKTCENRILTKIYTAESDLFSQTLKYRGLKSF